MATSPSSTLPPAPDAPSTSPPVAGSAPAGTRCGSLNSPLTNPLVHPLWWLAGWQCKLGIKTSFLGLLSPRRALWLDHQSATGLEWLPPSPLSVPRFCQHLTAASGRNPAAIVLSDVVKGCVVQSSQKKAGHHAASCMHALALRARMVARCRAISTMRRARRCWRCRAHGTATWTW